VGIGPQPGVGVKLLTNQLAALSLAKLIYNAISSMIRQRWPLLQDEGCEPLTLAAAPSKGLNCVDPRSCFTSLADLT
jgi:hypothetical protein